MSYLWVPAGGVEKFQLEETLPMVPARIISLIPHDEYVDMVELSEENVNGNGSG